MSKDLEPGDVVEVLKTREPAIVMAGEAMEPLGNIRWRILLSNGTVGPKLYRGVRLRRLPKPTGS